MRETAEQEQAYQTYETAQPWIVYTYPRTDEEADRLGEGRVDMLCAICGARDTVLIPLPPAGEPLPVETAEPGYRHPARERFLAEHIHSLQQTAPETWELPLLNPAAHSDTLMILRDVAEKARRSVEGSRDGE